MARNGSGTYTVPNTFVAGTTITASDHNENWSDIGSEITNSVATDGQTTMTGPLKASSGAVSAPSHTFGSDTDSGMYRAGADNPAIAAGGTKILDITTSGITVTGSSDATTIKQGGYRLVPAGAIMPYAGASAPDGWLLCYGQAVSRTTYADLFTAISTAHGTGDGSTTFNLPDMRGRAAFGKDDMGGSAASRITSAAVSVDGTSLGAAGGAQTVTLARANLPNTNVTVDITDPGHTHVENTGSGGGGSNHVAATTNGTTQSSNTLTASATTGISAAFNLNGSVSQTDVNKLPPAIILNYIIKT